MGAVGMESMAQSHCNTPQKHQVGLYLAKINSHPPPFSKFISPHWGWEAPGLFLWTQIETQ